VFISVCLLAGATALVLRRRHDAVDDEKSDRIASTAQFERGGGGSEAILVGELKKIGVA